MRKRRIAALIASVVFALFIIGYGFLFRFNIPPCVYYESQIDLPEVLIDSYLIFDEDKEYNDIVDRDFTYCNKSHRESSGLIKPTPTSRDPEYVSAASSWVLFRPVVEGTQFKILKYYTVHCTFCFEHYPNDYLLLQNDLGEKYHIFVKSRNDDMGGYYVNGIREGDVRDVFFPRK